MIQASWPILSLSSQEGLQGLVSSNQAAMFKWCPGAPPHHRLLPLQASHLLHPPGAPCLNCTTNVPKLCKT